MFFGWFAITRHPIIRSDFFSINTWVLVLITSGRRQLVTFRFEITSQRPHIFTGNALQGIRDIFGSAMTLRFRDHVVVWVGSERRRSLAAKKMLHVKGTRRAVLQVPPVCRGREALRPRQDGCYFADDILQCMSPIKKFEFCLKFHWTLFQRLPSDNNSALVQIMAWRRAGDKPLSGPMMTWIVGLNMLMRMWCTIPVHQRYSSILNKSFPLTPDLATGKCK